MNKHLERYKKWNDKIEVRLRKPLPYDFMVVFKLMVVIYIISTLFDLSLTYVHFHLSPDHFFKYEFSYIIERTFAGDKFYFLLSILFFLLPIWIVYSAPMKYKKKHGYYLYVSRYYLMVLYVGSLMHIYGGFTNFVYLISIRFI